MFRTLINSLLIVALNCYPVLAGIGNGSSFDTMTVYRGNGSTWDPVTVYYGNGSSWTDITETGSSELTIAISNATSTGGTVLGGNAKGNSFLATQTANLTKLNLSVYSYTAGAAITCRVGTTTNLSTYIEESTATVSGTGAITLTFGGTNQLTASTTYYFGCINNGTAVSLDKDDNEVYTDGQFIYDISAGWSCTYTAAADMIFEVVGE